MTDVAFIGLGAMGIAMARNIVEGGHTVVGFDTSEAAMEQHVANGGVSAPSATEAVRGAKIIITMLPIGAVVQTVLLGPPGAVENIDAGAIVIDMSTIHPSDTDDIRDGLKAHDVRMIDAPVGRTSVQAETGTLLIMAGGDSADIEEVRPVLECMGDLIIDCGGPGMGSRMKITNNLMTTVLNVLTAEVLTLGEATGLDRDLAIEVMSGTAAGLGHMSTTYPAKVLKDDLTPAFMIDLARKDLGIAIEMAEKTGVPLALAENADTVYADAQSAGRGAEDWTAIYAMMREKQIS
ncbi:MAG: sulfolactaldehyde 3-reductase [Rhodospirillaceae bacterium]|nr:sulfolactaldehyde 3-reductase [Rhodospirillaceae bacterium]MBT5512585.1 sulfolactaldehyde 3-reductase [Rhodospirillaceae bacterium]MBT6085748.1 sulfolactaldehyde 3-reductase [Rhodospirillaceae bacterium]MBT6883153.1 sulfolactaldehyde 3-reductase [Rhodospirillaceae bacterium]MBT7511496.1 sulfolactaldehyde 3-reductase [Rhodospirillaceae bacterium]